MIHKIGIIGLGVIGASLGMALRSCCPEIIVAGRDLDGEIVTRAIELGALDLPLDDQLLAECDLVIMATPLQAMAETIKQIKDHIKPGAIISDVGSVKSWVMQLLEENIPAAIHIIGGHPMAGSEKSGLQAADKFLLQNAAYILTPRPGTAEKPLQELTELLKTIGARVVIMNAREHDQAVARVSHLPHLMSAALVNNLAAKPEFLALAGGGLRDSTRTAASDPDLWQDILMLNRDAVIEELESMLQILIDVQLALQYKDGEMLHRYLQTACTTRKNVPSLRPCLEDARDLIAIIPDQPGVIGIIGTLLGHADINIQILQLLNVRDEDEGSIKITVPGEKAFAACELLKKQGFQSWLLEK
ncbi:MAG: prephenate dehydrogenase [Syntrophomonadaceae bacterium]|nr:prephenate dehydrogenase [Syntrophomonadaceae bacterium]